MSDERERESTALFAEMRAMVEHENMYLARRDIPHSGLRYGVDFAKLEKAFNAAMHIVDRLTAERDQAREQLVQLRAACQTVLARVNEIDDELSHLDYDDRISADSMIDIQYDLYAVGIGSQEEREAGIERLNKYLGYKRDWLKRVPEPHEARASVQAEMLQYERLLAATRAALGIESEAGDVSD